MRLSLLLALVAACAGNKDRAERAPPPPPLAADAAPASPPAADAAPPPPTSPTPDASMTTFDRAPLPVPFDLRVTRVLDEPVPDDVVLAVAVVSMGPSPRINQRFDITADGRFFHVKHSGKGGDWQVPFDRPLPRKPAATLPAADVDGWLRRLDAAGFFDHPGYEADPRVEDGSFVIVRARRGGAVHSVVYQNARPAPIDELARLGDVVLASHR